MNTSTLRLTGLSALSLAAGACTDGSVQNDPRPNIVLFLADDIGAECFGCMGGVSYDTHTIDSLARNGLFFPNMHAQPLSSPSRVQLMTGQYNDRNYVCFGYMNDDDPNFAQLARQAGRPAIRPGCSASGSSDATAGCPRAWDGTSGAFSSSMCTRSSTVRPAPTATPTA